MSPKKEQKEPASILVVDDDENFCLMLKDMLEREGYKISLAHDGVEAIGMHRENHYNLTIMDLFMREKQGIDTIIELRRDYLEVKIIAVSGGHLDGYDNKEIFLNAAKEQGAVQVFGKPIEKEKFVKAIRETLM